MQTLIIYDNNGEIYSKITGSFVKPDGLQHLVAEEQEGKFIAKIDTTSVPHIPVYEEKPKPKEEELQEQIDVLNIALAEVLGV